MEVMLAMVKMGNPNSISDAGVGALAARSAVMGASLNVKINAGAIHDKQFAKDLIGKVTEIEQKTKVLESQILEIVERQLEG